MLKAYERAEWWLRRVLISLAFGAVGAASGALLKPTASHACDCSSPKWSMSLASLQSSMGVADDSAYWPAEAVVAPLPETVSLHFDAADDVWQIEANAQSLGTFRIPR
jgi:hypothetical protein